MSEIINNREYRQKALKEIITDLHKGASAESVKKRFAELIKDVAPTEIAEMEQALINEGMPAEEIKRLCDVHVSVFKESLDEMVKSDEVPGHPVYTFRQENRAVEKLIEESIKPYIDKYKNNPDDEALLKLREGLNMLMDLDKHYSRKENLLFPYLEKYGITAPPTVMWGIDDDIRAKIKSAIAMAREADKSQAGELTAEVESLISIIKDMIYKEENILFPMCLETLTQEEWGHILEGSDEIGFCLVEPENKWKPDKVPAGQKEELESAKVSEGLLKFPTGVLTLKEITAIFNTLPVDITFVDKDDVVKYFSQSKDRIFARPKTIIGRRVQYCHPPKSVHVIEKILEDFKTGRREHADFWINMGGAYVYIRYFAVKDAEGNYLGTLEVTQNIKDIQEIKGEKRLLED